MSTLLKTRQDDLRRLSSEAEAILGKGELTAEDRKSIGELTTQINDTKAEVEAIAGLSGATTDLKSFMFGDQRTESITSKLGVQGAGELVGSETYGIGADGRPVALESSGWGLSEKQFAAISEKKYASAWWSMMRGKADTHDFRSTLYEGRDDAGGYLVPPQVVNQVIMRKPHPTALLDYVTTFPCSRDSVLYPKLNYTGTDDTFTSPVRLQWVGDSGPGGTVTDPSFGEVEIPIYTGLFPIEVNRNLLEDAASPVGTLIMQLAQQAYRLGMESVVVGGTGIKQPRGFLLNPGGTNEPSSINCGNPITADGLTYFVQSMPPQYEENSIAVMNKISAWATFAQIKDGNGQYIFGLARHIDEGLATKRQPVLFGQKVVYSAFMPDVGANAFPLAYGDFSESYVLAQRVGLSVFPYGDQDKSMLGANKVGWYFRLRAGGSVVQNRALRVGKQA